MNKEIPSEAYTKDYFLSSSVEGYQEFLDGSMSHTKQKLLEMLAVEPGMHCLEVGVGRGEFLRQCAKIGANVTGIDYSDDALEIAKEALSEYADATIQKADARALPFDADSFDRVFAGDVIEHLSFEDGVLMLKEMYRVLKPGGYILIHTAPNPMFTKVVYPLTRFLLKRISPETTNTLDAHLEVGGEFHVHEYSLLSLKRVARKAQLPSFAAWIDKDVLRSGQHRLTQNLQKSAIMKFAVRCAQLSTVRFWIGNDLYLKCVK